MATYYVSVQTGDDQNDGLSPETAWATLTKAATTVVAGDTVYVAPGVYREMLSPVNSGEEGNPIRFIADPWAVHWPELSPGEVHITGVDSETQDTTTARLYGIRLYRINYIECEGFTISRCKEAGVYIDGFRTSIDSTGREILLRFLNIHHCTRGVQRIFNLGTNTGTFVLPMRVAYCTIDAVQIGIEDQHYTTRSSGNSAHSGGQALGCRIAASSIGIRFYAAKDSTITNAGVMVEGDVTGGSVKARTAFKNESARLWAGGMSTIRGVEVEAETVVEWGSYPSVTLNDLDVRYCNTLTFVSSGGGAAKVISGARIQFVSNLGSGFSVGQPIYGPIPDHERRSGAGIDPYNAISGTQSVRVAVPQYAMHEWNIPAAAHVPLNVTLKARKSFQGGSVRFYLGPEFVDMADTTDVQVLHLSYRPRVTGMVTLRLVAEAPSYTGSDAVWVDDIIVG